MTVLYSDASVGEVKRIRGKKLPLTAAGVRARKGLRWSDIGGIVPP